MTMTKTDVKIQEFLVGIVLSSNQFEGSIPEDIQILKGLQLPNLSNNFHSGPISPSLPQNKLSGDMALG
ncbi:hypothetical protein COLO4_33354 [Corchorus olitorius]|uniref:Uncharacterized protein n=1 Tax=Corchorus olitorius TaxID=93759 RepID=A0A1R3GUD8_9ROSI|nr:hypothetical protein COLO4_33354 [Corchorus olitorius]